jgi:putative two-component system response regulator
MKTIFVIDDSDTNLAVVEEALEDHFNVITLPSAAKMFSLFEKLTPDLILLDIEMPEMNGFEALEKLKSDNFLAKIPVFFLTSTINASIEEKCSKLGAIGIITKPFSKDALINIINSHI